MQKVGTGGSCHWCTEAVFLSLKGVTTVVQGWLASAGEDDSLSEGVIIEFDEQLISLCTLIEVHLHTHSCTSNHPLRHRYRSAVYAYTEPQKEAAKACLTELQADFDKPVVTKALICKEFMPSRQQIQDYYYSNPDKPFCTTQITPKLKRLLERFGDIVNVEKKTVIERSINQKKAAETMITKHEYSVEHDTAKQQYRVQVQPELWALVTYTKQDKVLHLNYSEVPHELRGQGYGSVLMEAVLTQIQSEGYKVVPVCSYIRCYIDRHERWASLLADV
ncbi:N-acetyltransferase [Photobacterium sagamiensis]|uniref:N-acetyltransferase n=1 Tax=Photobacterium sagamiensis TaxID=2910241 RepID=UPI003D0FDB1C